MNYQILVNKQISLGKDYIPSNLVSVNSKYKEGMQLEAKTYEQWLLLKDDVLSKCYIIDIESAYRSYDYQQKVMNELIAEKGEEYAKRAIAVPGHSEHQTGLALDYCLLRDNTFIIEGDMTACDECIYTNSIAHKYGFILRYPQDKENITGYKYEPWHLRYVGVELATYLYENKLTLDEYYKEEMDEQD